MLPFSNSFKTFKVLHIPLFRREVVQFLDPKNPHWSRYEAINLISRADTNGDGLLDLEEVLAHPDLFLFSKLAGGDAGFHGEF